jgi:hypothetical protein
MVLPWDETEQSDTESSYVVVVQVLASSCCGRGSSPVKGLLVRTAVLAVVSSMACMQSIVDRSKRALSSSLMKVAAIMLGSQCNGEDMKESVERNL